MAVKVELWIDSELFSSKLLIRFNQAMEGKPEDALENCASLFHEPTATGLAKSRPLYCNGRKD